jgi:hypothetical protein
MKRIFVIVLNSTLVGLLASASAHETKNLLTVNDFFGGFEGASVINPKQLGRNYFSLEPQSSKIKELKNSIAKYYDVKRWDHEGLLIASRPTIAKLLDIATTLPEFALSFDSAGNLKNPVSMRQQGVDVLQGTFECLKSLP